LMNRLDSRGSG